MASDDLESRFARLRQSLSELRPGFVAKRIPEVWGAPAEWVEPNPPLSEAELAAYEAEHGIRLPANYREFLAAVGNGGPGPAGRLFELNAPFLHTALAPQVPSPVSGLRRLVVLANLGCGMEWELVVDGPDAGEVWFYCEAGFEACDPPCDFLNWYETWLTDQREPGKTSVHDLLASIRNQRSEAGEHEQIVDEIDGVEMPF